MSDVAVTVGGGTGVTVAVNGNTTLATVTAGGSVSVTLTDTSPPTWSGITGKPTTFPPQAHSHSIGEVTGLQAALDQKVELDGLGKVPASQLPSYVDDVLEYANAAARPATGETGKIYVTIDNGKIFRWSGSTYIEISAAPGSTDFVPEGTGNLYHTTARAAAAAPVQSVAGRTGTVVLAVGDVSGAVASTDARLSDAREWSASTISQAEAEAGTATDRRAFTALRVFQAIAAWWAGSAAKTKLDGIATGATANATDAQLRDRSTHTGTQAASTITGLAAVATSGAYGDLSGTPAAYSLPTASGSTLGGVKIGSGVSIDGNGVISVSAYSLPAATTSTLGGVIVGSGLSVSSGTVSANVTSVAGRTGAVTIAAADVSGLGSLATQSSVAYSSLTGIPSTFTPSAHNQAWSTITATPTTLSGYGITDAVASSDARLTDARTPTDGSVTDAKITSGGLSASSINWVAIQPWAANTAYAKGDLVSFQGVAYRRSAAGTSGSTFNATNWQQITPSEFVASQITSGTVATARLGSGAANSGTFLRGDQTWAAPPVTSVDGNTGAVTLTKAQVFEFTRSSAPAGVTGSNGSWTGFSIPANARLVEFLVIGAGAGGGSGRRGAAGTARFGGGGGASGATISTLFNPALITTTIGIAIGVGGAGGAAVTADDTNGNTGTSGGQTFVYFNSGTPFIAFAGLGGSGGTATAGSGGSFGGSSENRTFVGTSGSNSSVTGNANRAFSNGNVPQGGGAGGGISTANVAYLGGGQLALGLVLAESAQFGSNGAGGAASVSAAGGNGTNGISYGYGGCGGGASANGNNSGSGGNGGDGYVRITVWS